MRKKPYDVAIVGARIAGSALAWELGRAGYEVLLLDRARFPSDVLSTHNFFNNSVAMLREMGVLDRLLATGTPTYRRAFVQMEDAVIDGLFPEAAGETDCLCIRRTHLDRILFEHAASLPNVTAREQFRATGLLREGDTVVGVEGVGQDGKPESCYAKLVVGADGRRSQVRQWAGSVRKTAVPTDFASYVGYFEGFRQDGERCTEFYKMGEYVAIVFPTSDNLYVIGLMVPLAWRERLDKFAREPETSFRESIDAGFAATSFPQRLRDAKLVGPIKGLHGYDNDWYEEMGRGWALTGDALAFKDPAVGQGQHDALYGARVLTKVLASRASWEPHWKAMAGEYAGELERKLLARFYMACHVTKNVPLSPEQTAVNRLIGSVPEATSAFLGIYNHTNEPHELEHIVANVLQRREAAEDAPR
ncbi:FAD-dependent oxidoreductase [Paenibacillus flagellatus]|uniref:NAD(P)/FAD-dependent oxidoreductase n=1 Tax=Paenibacillus flagellatus TaxID=2211139 RepID=A0A2V5KBH1_9BACL|nr:NAD(P)/FAD-dependent oxidoreductase [Paenibacillus flagellatus]PYI56899.1 NAD(P)/FAD-dependent oxidoreductase [Paenibacillus flagellatus]